MVTVPRALDQKAVISESDFSLFLGQRMQERTRLAHVGNDGWGAGVSHPRVFQESSHFQARTNCLSLNSQFHLGPHRLKRPQGTSLSLPMLPFSIAPSRSILGINKIEPCPDRGSGNSGQERLSGRT